MALPLAPVAAFALRYGTVALATYAVARQVERGRRGEPRWASFVVDTTAEEREAARARIEAAAAARKG